jgi:hypothetical protein
MDALTRISTGRPRLAFAFSLVLALIVAGCKNGGGSGY